MAIRERGKRLYHDFYFYLPNGARTRAFEPAGPATKKNRKIVESKEKAIKYHLKNGSFSYPDFFPHGSKISHFESKTDITFDQFRSEIMGEISNKSTTIENKENLYRTNVVDAIGQMPISTITEHDLLVFRRQLKDKGTLANNSINLIFRHTCGILKKAVKRKLIEDNPCDDIQPLKETKTNIQPFSFEELQHFIEKLKKVDREWHDLVVFWSHTGLRPGEMLALKWEDLDLFNETISIRRTRTGNRDTTPKTAHSERDIRLIETALDAIKRQQERTALKSEYVWPQMWIDHFRDRFKKLCRICGLKQRPPSQMRHTFATLHIASGENPEWVSKTMGHSSLKITLERYSKFIPNLTRTDGSAFDAMLKKGNKQGNKPAKVLKLG